MRSEIIIAVFVYLFRSALALAHTLDLAIQRIEALELRVTQLESK